jgi:hypothetical protein
MATGQNAENVKSDAFQEAVTQYAAKLLDRGAEALRACRYTEVPASPSSRNKRMVSAAI